MTGLQTIVQPPLSASEAEAIATAAALHHLRAASAAGGPAQVVAVETGWSREALLAGVDRGTHRLADASAPPIWS